MKPLKIVPFAGAFAAIIVALPAPLLAEPVASADEGQSRDDAPQRPECREGRRLHNPGRSMPSRLCVSPRKAAELAARERRAEHPQK